MICGILEKHLLTYLVLSWQLSNCAVCSSCVLYDCCWLIKKTWTTEHNSKSWKSQATYSHGKVGVFSKMPDDKRYPVAEMIHCSNVKEYVVFKSTWVDVDLLTTVSSQSMCTLTTASTDESTPCNVCSASQWKTWTLALQLSLLQAFLQITYHTWQSYQNSRHNRRNWSWSRGP